MMLITKRRLELEREHAEMSRFLAETRPKVEALLRTLAQARRRRY